MTSFDHLTINGNAHYLALHLGRPGNHPGGRGTATWWCGPPGTWPGAGIRTFW